MLAAFALAAGCGEPDTCEQLLGNTYQSTTNADVGLGPEGVVYGPLSIEFRRETVQRLTRGPRERDAWYWQQGDYGDAGVFTCSGDAVALRDFDDVEKYVASYDATSDSLSLDGLTYVRVAAP